jgi:hypothetical protein
MEPEQNYRTFTPQHLNLDVQENYERFLERQTHFIHHTYTGSYQGGGSESKSCRCLSYNELLIQKIEGCILNIDNESIFSQKDDSYLDIGHKKALQNIFRNSTAEILLLCAHKLDSDSLCAKLPKDVIQLIIQAKYPLANFETFHNLVINNRKKWEREKLIHLESEQFPSNSDLQLLNGSNLDKLSLINTLPHEVVKIILSFKYIIFLENKKVLWQQDHKFSSLEIVMPSCKCFSKEEKFSDFYIKNKVNGFALKQMELIKTIPTKQLLNSTFMEEFLNQESKSKYFEVKPLKLDDFLVKEIVFDKSLLANCIDLIEPIDDKVETDTKETDNNPSCQLF